MSSTLINDLAVCVDCAAAIANGDFPEDTEAEKAITDGFDREDGWNWVLDCGEDCEGWFSWTPCDNCRRPLGGERHPAALIKIN